MKKYNDPTLDILKLDFADIVTASIEDEWIGLGEYDEDWE